MNLSLYIEEAVGAVEVLRKMGGDRPVFCGNFEYDASVREIERLFERYGPLDRVDMKTGEELQKHYKTTPWTTLLFAPSRLIYLRGTCSSSTSPTSSCNHFLHGLSANTEVLPINLPPSTHNPWLNLFIHVDNIV